MKNFETIYDENTLSIFSDASMYSGNYLGYSVGCAGVEMATSATRTDVLTNAYPTGYIPNYVVTVDTSNNNSELLALRQAILFAIANKHRFQTINIYSDSLLSVNSINQWSEGWFYKALKENTDWIFKNSSGSAVANQQVIKNIIVLIYFNDLRVNIYHQRGHCVGNLSLVKRDFARFNGIPKRYISDRFIKEISDLNDLVDRRSRDIMRTFVKTGYAPYIVNNTLIPGIEYDVSKINYKYFKGLIGRN